MRCIRNTVLAVGALLPLIALAQYPGQVKKKSKDTPDLRAVAVLEWTGEVGKPKACRIVPITVYDGEKLQDGGIYMARPQPLALSAEVEYELTYNGKTVGLFVVENAGQEQGTWVGYGKWRAAPAPKPKMTVPEKIDDFQDQKPVLHRKRAGEAPDSDTKGGADSPTSSQPAAPDDPDRPTLHKSPEKSGTKTNTGEAPAPDPGQPQHQKTPPQLAQDMGNVDSVDANDPDRPTLKRGKSSGSGTELAPTLMGMPPDLQQAVAVSDAKTRPDHPWTYAWANPDDEKKMQSEMEEIAREMLGLAMPPAQAASAPKKAGAPVHKTARPAASPAAPAPLIDEQFRVFELAYGSGATMVLTATNDAPPPSRKFVTIIAQPDLYGNVRVLLKSVTDMAHLDETPRMRLVDAVDALADNRGELLFELRGDGSRQFALYRIYRGTAEKLFVSGGGFYGTLSRE
jgi:hypothetical protein